jgi:hypothetical protein
MINQSEALLSIISSCAAFLVPAFSSINSSGICTGSGGSLGSFGLLELGSSSGCTFSSYFRDGMSLNLFCPPGISPGLLAFLMLESISLGSIDLCISLSNGSSLHIIGIGMSDSSLLLGSLDGKLTLDFGSCSSCIGKLVL